jgi:hypothetical protein
MSLNIEPNSSEVKINLETQKTKKTRLLSSNNELKSKSDFDQYGVFDKHSNKTTNNKRKKPEDLVYLKEPIEFRYSTTSLCESNNILKFNSAASASSNVLDTVHDDQLVPHSSNINSKQGPPTKDEQLQNFANLNIYHQISVRTQTNAKNLVTVS